MVLILGLFGCLAARAPVVAQQAVPVTTVVTLANPEAGLSTTQTDAVLSTLQSHFAARGWNLQPASTSEDFDQLGTSGRRVRWLVEHSGDSLSVLIETTVRSRSQLGGRFQWVVDASITVAGDGTDPLVHHVRLPTTLPHIHQGEREALQAVASRLAAETSLQIARHQRAGK